MCDVQIGIHMRIRQATSRTAGEWYIFSTENQAFKYTGGGSHKAKRHREQYKYTMVDTIETIWSQYEWGHVADAAVEVARKSWFGVVVHAVQVWTLQ